MHKKNKAMLRKLKIIELFLDNPVKEKYWYKRIGIDAELLSYVPEQEFDVFDYPYSMGTVADLILGEEFV